MENKDSKNRIAITFHCGEKFLFIYWTTSSAKRTFAKCMPPPKYPPSTVPSKDDSAITLFSDLSIKRTLAITLPVLTSRLYHTAGLYPTIVPSNIRTRSDRSTGERLTPVNLSDRVLILDGTMV